MTPPPIGSSHHDATLRWVTADFDLSLFFLEFKIQQQSLSLSVEALLQRYIAITDRLSQIFITIEMEQHESHKLFQQSQHSQQQRDDVDMMTDDNDDGSNNRVRENDEKTKESARDDDLTQLELQKNQLFQVCLS